MIALLLILGLFGGSLFAGTPVLRGFDPVLLTQGQETAGRADLSYEYKGFTYQFATEANRDAFKKSPSRYEIQFDGACGKMGPGTGQGSPDRFWVYDNRIYVFASDSCLKTFQGNPTKHIETPQPAPNPTASQSKAGRALLDLAVTAVGGANEIDGLQTYQERSVTDVAPKKHAAVRTAWIVEWPNRFRHETEYQEWGTLAEIVNGKVGDYQSPDGLKPATEADRAAYQRSFESTVLAILRARKDKGFAVWVAEGTNDASVPIHTVETYAFGRRYSIEIERRTGRVVSLAYQGRGPGGPVGQIREVYSDFRRMGPLTLPHRVVTTFDTYAWPARSYRVEGLSINQPIDSALFRVGSGL